MSNKDYCLQLAANIPPSKGRSCPACSLGPCLFVQTPSPGGPGRKKRSSQPRHRKTFPVVRHTDYFYSQNSAILPYYGDAYYLTEGQWDPVNYRVEVDLVNEVTEIRELNRLSSSRGTQVVHNKFYVHPSLVTELGPEFIFKSEGPSGSPGVYAWAFAPECYFASNLMVAAYDHFNSRDFGIADGLQEEVRVTDGFAFSAMRPAFKTGFSALNFLLEMDDLTKLVPSLIKSWRAFENTFYQLDKVIIGRGYSKPTLGQMMDAVADNHLAYQFGVLPTIGDVQTAVSILDRVRANVARFKHGAKQLLNTRHFKASFEPTTEYTDTLKFTTFVTIGNFRWEYECSFNGFEPISNGTPADHISYNASMEFTYYCKTLGDIDPLVAALYTQFGIKPDASILWNAIPFSFVLDWFVDIGAFLEKYASVDLITSEVTIHAWWLGLKARPTWKCVPVNATCDATGVEKPVIGSAPIVTVYGQSYSRLIHDVDVEQLVDINSQTPDGLTLHRGLLSASLLKKLVFR